MRHLTTLAGFLTFATLLVAQPVITGVTPKSAAPGAELDIRGRFPTPVTHIEFTATVGGFRGIDRKTVAVTSASATIIKVTVPSMAAIVPPNAVPPGTPVGSIRAKDSNGAFSAKHRFVFRQGAEPFDGVGAIEIRDRDAEEKAVVFTPVGGTKSYRLVFEKGVVAPDPGTRVWVEGSVRADVMYADHLLVFRHRRPQDVGRTARLGSVSATLTRVYAWCDHMPGPGDGRARQHLLVDVTLENSGTEAVTLRFDPVFISLRKDAEGQRTAKVSIRGADGAGTGKSTYTLSPGKHVVQLRGDGVFPEDAHAKKLWVMLAISDGKDRVTIRKSGAVQVTH